MIGALRYEMVRIRTIASSYWMSAIAIVLSTALSLVLLLVVNSTLPSDMSEFQATTWVITAGASAVAMPVLAAVFFAVMGALAMGHEYRYGTNKATLTALPDRVAVIAAKVVVLTAWVVTVAGIILVINVVMSGLWLDDFHLDSTAVRPLVNYFGYCIGFALAGLSLAAIFRNQTGAIVMALVWPLVIEVIVLTVLRAIRLNSSARLTEVYNILPASAGRRTMFSPYDLFASLDTDQTGVWGLEASTLVFWVAIAGLLAIATALFLTRDA